MRTRPGPRLGPRLAQVAFVLVVLGTLTVVAGPAAAQDPAPLPDFTVPPVPVPGADTDAATADGGSMISIDIGSGEDGASQSLVLIVILAVIGIAPSLVIMLTSFTRIVVVLSLTRNALGLQGIPPNQVLVGLALFLSLFVMAPTLAEMNEAGLQPYLDGETSAGDAFDAASAPLKGFMLDHTRSAELSLMIEARDEIAVADPDDLSLVTVIPAFILSELRTAFTIGFVIFVPFLVIDLVVSSVLMSLGMMMLPPVFVSLPFKLLLFVMVGGWSLLTETLLASFV